MAAIYIVDDDYAMEILVETLSFYGHDVTRIASVDEAISNIENIVESDLLILDLIMEPLATEESRAISGGMVTGMEIYHRVRTKNTHLPILVNTGAIEERITSLVDQDPNAQFRSKWSTPKLTEFVSTVHGLLGIEMAEHRPRAFIVHGHDDKTKLEVKNYLQNTLGIDEPIVLHEQPNGGMTVIEKFEHYAELCTIAFVLLTPDDKIADCEASDDEKRRARQNVIFELGYFLAALGRLSGHVVLLHKGPVELPSDISGLLYVDIQNGIDAAGEKLRKELKDVL